MAVSAWTKTDERTLSVLILADAQHGHHGPSGHGSRKIVAVLLPPSDDSGTTDASQHQVGQGAWQVLPRQPVPGARELWTEFSLGHLDRARSPALWLLNAGCSLLRSTLAAALQTIAVCKGRQQAGCSILLVIQTRTAVSSNAIDRRGSQQAAFACL